MNSSFLRAIGLAMAVALAAGAQPVKVQKDAASNFLEWEYQQPAQTILNRDGGPWEHLDLMTMSIDQLSNYTQTYTVNGSPFTIGPLRLIHAFICLNPVGVNYNACNSTNPNPKPLTAADIQVIDAALAKVVQARIKIILRFAYNHGAGDDAPLDVILSDIRSLAPLVKKYKSVIYAMNTGFIGYWGEGHDSTNGNNTQDNMRQILQAEQLAFKDATFMLNRQPANILSWELGSKPYWGIHDDHYITGDDAGTWLSHPWDNGNWQAPFLQAFAATRTDVLPFSGEVGGNDSTTQTCENFDRYSSMVHLNMMNVGFAEHMDVLTALPCYPDLINRIGPAISLTKVQLDAPLTPGSTRNLILYFQNTGYSRLFSPKPVYFVLADAAGNRLSSSVFAPIRISYDLRTLASGGGQGSASVRIPVPSTLPVGLGYQAALWIPDDDRMLATIPEYNYLLNNQGVPNVQTGINILFPLDQ